MGFPFNENLLFEILRKEKQKKLKIFNFNYRIIWNVSNKKEKFKKKFLEILNSNIKYKFMIEFIRFKRKKKKANLNNYLYRLMKIYRLNI